MALDTPGRTLVPSRYQERLLYGRALDSVLVLLHTSQPARDIDRRALQRTADYLRSGDDAAHRRQKVQTVRAATGRAPSQSVQDDLATLERYVDYLEQAARSSEPPERESLERLRDFLQRAYESAVRRTSEPPDQAFLED